jgi:hypothetical protein
MPRRISSVKGSMLLTAIFLLTVFCALIAIMSRVFMGQEDVELSSVYGTQAQALARSGTEFALGALFVPGKTSAVESKIFEGSFNLVADSPFTVIECNGYSENESNFCRVNNRCKLDKVTVSVNNLEDIVTDADVKYEYYISAKASCEIPLVNGLKSYKVTRQLDTFATDVRWTSTRK